MVESCSTLPSLFVFADFSSSRIWRWTMFWKNDKTKRADYTKHQKLVGASLSLQSDVLCNRLWKIKVGFCLIQLPPTEPKAWWSSSALPVYRYRVGWIRLMVEHWYLVVYVADHRCATIIQIHHLSVKFLNVSHCIRNFKERFSTGAEKDPSTG